MTTLEPPPLSVRKPVLLIVDDEAGPRESLRIVFKDRCECLLATCGQEGIRLARQCAVDAAILDIRMPDLTGIEVLRELKAIDPAIECVMLTGYETVETARAAVHHGAAEYLNKPFDVFAIRDIIENCLARRKRNRDVDADLETLRQSKGQLSDTLAARARANITDILSSSIVHELNNPLSIIAGYVQLLNRDLAKLTDGDTGVTQHMQQRVTAIQRELQRCKQLSERFLHFSRSPNGQSEIINVASLLEDVALLLRAHPAGKSATIHAHSLSPSLLIRAVSVEIMQILMNLGVNALQAMDASGTLRFSAEHTDLPSTNCAHRSAGYDPRRPHVRISVSDTGCGIAPENIQKVFAAYFTTKTEGNGLGLAVVGELINKYHGAVEIISAVGKGATFNVYLPLFA